MDILPGSNEEYSQKKYWDDRYTSSDEVFDWFKSFKDISSIVEEFIPNKSSRILMLGCGNSTLSEEMYDAGYQNIVNVDYSGIVIRKMKARNIAREGMEWQEMDVRALEFEDDSFDVAIDKGTMDAMLAVKGDVWNPPAGAVDDCNKEVAQVMRVLKKSGTFLYLTFGQPHFRRRYLERPDTSLEIRTLGDMFHYYLYIVRPA